MALLKLSILLCFDYICVICNFESFEITSEFKLNQSKMKFALSVLVIVLFASAGISQTNTDVSENVNQDLLTSDERARVSALRNDLGLIVGQQEEDIRLVQMGDGNLADLQLRQTLESDRARLAVSQTGGVVGNSINLQFQGSGVDMSVLQLGDGNLYNADLTGTAQSLDILQEGFNNEIRQNVELESGAQIELIQLGDDNFLNADGVGRSIQVTQRNGGRAVLSELDN